MLTLTEEQKDIINSLKTDDKIIKINAYAGTGKTSTIIELIKEIRKQDKDCNILYLVYNRNAKEDAEDKFNALGLNVECFTAHGFALKRMSINVFKDNKKYGTDNKIRFLDNIFGSKDEDTEYMDLRSLPKYKYVSYAKVSDLFDAYCKVFDEIGTFCSYARRGGYASILNTDPKEIDIEFFSELYPLFLEHYKFTHGMYLKEYVIHCKETVSKYKYVFLDEAQDLNPFMLGIVKKLIYEKMYVTGDTYQQIYRWNGAINALSNFNCPTYPLSKSFRITDEECKIANALLSSSYKDFKTPIVNVKKKDLTYDKNKQTVLFRTNGAMFDYAVYLMLDGNVKVHFMDTIGGEATNDFEDTFGVLLYFFKKLMECNVNMKDDLKRFKKLFKIKRSCKEIDVYLKMTKNETENFRNYLFSNPDILRLDHAKYWKFYRENERNIVDILVKMRDSENIENPEKEYWLCTAHRSKGLEWENVKIASDKWRVDNSEDVNLLYVACTRAKKNLDWNAVSSLINIEDEVEYEDYDEYVNDMPVENYEMAEDEIFTNVLEEVWG